MAASPRSSLIELLHAAVAAADPATATAAALPDRPDGRVVVVGAGKAGARMAGAVEAAWPGAAVSGSVAVPAGTHRATRDIELIEAGHPVPDAASVAAARRLRERVTGLGRDDLVLALFSGGGSALACEPGAGLSLADKQAVTRRLLASGATIREINAVRQALSGIKGGRLAAAAAPARVHTLIISDVPGDDPALVASGPTVASPFEPGDAARIAARHGVEVPAPARERLEAPDLPDAAALAGRCTHAVVASAMQSLEAAAAEARRAGITPLVLGDGLEGEAREMARVHAGIARSVRRWHHPVAPPAVLLSGGEATVTLGDASGGRGGRNTEFALALALELAGAEGIHGLAADTDGIDGIGEHAGAVVAPDTLARAAEAGMDAREALAAHRSADFFEALGDLLDTGPTGTNVNDFRAIRVD